MSEKSPAQEVYRNAMKKARPADHEWALQIIGGLERELNIWRDAAQEQTELVALQSAELGRLEAELQGIADREAAVLKELPTDEQHCSCAAVLFRRTKELEAEVERLRELIAMKDDTIEAGLIGWDAIGLIANTLIEAKKKALSILGPEEPLKKGGE